MDIGAAIQRLREQRGLTQVRLAARAGISQSYLAKLEPPTRRGVEKTVRFRNPTITVIQQLADALGISVEALLKEARRTK